MTHFTKLIPRLSFILILLISFVANIYCQTQAPPSRRELNTLPSSDLSTLRNLIIAWAPSHLLLHKQCSCHDDNSFFSWHRTHIQDLELYLISQGYPQFVPLPKWSPNTDIPFEFTGSISVVSGPGIPTHNPPVNTNPQIDISRWDRTQFNQGNDLERFCKGGTGIDCNFNFVDPFTDFRRCFEDFHGDVHVAVDGTFADFDVNPDSADPSGVAIFWPWHAWVDDVYETYLCICNQDNHDYFGNNEEWDNFDRSVSNISNSENTYSAFRNLTSDVTIPSNRNITFRAGNLIELNSGFETQTGAIFTAFIDACPRYGDQTPARHIYIPPLYPTQEEVENTLKNTQTKEEKINSKIIIYPNPTTGIINTSIPTNFFSGKNNTNPIEINIYTMLGEKIYSSVIETTHSKIDISSQSKGIYIIMIQVGEDVFVNKLILQK